MFKLDSASSSFVVGQNKGHSEESVMIAGDLLTCMLGTVTSGLQGRPNILKVSIMKRTPRYCSALLYFIPVRHPQLHLWTFSADVASPSAERERSSAALLMFVAALMADFIAVSIQA